VYARVHRRVQKTKTNRVHNTRADCDRRALLIFTRVSRTRYNGICYVGLFQSGRYRPVVGTRGLQGGAAESPEKFEGDGRFKKRQKNMFF